MSQKLLTIAIPTYNRSKDLSICLEHIVKQFKQYQTDVNLIISDNASLDNTPDIVTPYLDQNLPIKYIRNKSNIGPDLNFLQCFNLAQSKYVLIFGDDDILLDGALSKIILLLKKGDYGIIQLSSYMFRDDYLKEAPPSRPPMYYLYNSIPDFIIRCNIAFTFISVNIFNKSLVNPRLNFRNLNKTYIIQLGWTLSALFNSKQNIFIYDYCIAEKASEVSALNHIQIYAINFERIIRFFGKQGVNKRNVNTLEDQVMYRDIFATIYLMRKENPVKFKQQNVFNTLYSAYGHNIRYWLLLWPVSKFPFKLIRIYFFLDNKYREIKRFLFARI